MAIKTDRGARKQIGSIPSTHSHGVWALEPAWGSRYIGCMFSQNQRWLIIFMPSENRMSWKHCKYKCWIPPYLGTVMSLAPVPCWNWARQSLSDIHKHSKKFFFSQFDTSMHSLLTSCRHFYANISIDTDNTCDSIVCCWAMLLLPWQKLRQGKVSVFPAASLNAV